MDRLNDLPFRKKLQLMLVAPLAGLLFFGAVDLTSKFTILQSTSQTQREVEFAVTLDGIVAELQRERGRSSGYVGAHGQRGREELKKQRARTNARLDSNREVLLRAEHEEALGRSAGSWLKRLDKLSEVRDGIDKLDQGDFQAFFSDLIADAYGMIETIRFRVADLDQAKALADYAALLSAIENAGRERAALNAVFSGGDEGPDVESLALSFAALQKHQLNLFRASADSERVNELERTMNDPAFARVKELRATFANRVRRLRLVNEIQTQAGYGGLIHHFKNYLLRGQEEDRKQGQQNTHRIQLLLSELQELSGITSSEREDIRAISATFADYRVAIADVARMRQEGRSANEIDTLVAIDDAPTHLALSRLVSGIQPNDVADWFDVSTRRIDLLRTVANSATVEALRASRQTAASAATTLTMFIVFALAAVLSSMFFGLVVARRTTAITQVTTLLDDLAQNRSRMEPIMAAGRDEIGLLQQSYNQLVASSTETCRLADQIAQGDFTAEIQPRSDYDQLGRSLFSMTQSLREVGHVCQGLAQGDLSRKAEIKGDRDLLAISVNHMSESLRKTSEGIEREQWLKVGQAQLLEIMRGNLEVDELATRVISFLTKYLGAQVGVFYLVDSEDDQTLRLTGSYAHTQRDQTNTTLRLGEGLSGQAALERETILVADLDEDYIQVNSALGQAPPRNLVTSPFVLGDRLKGVLEIGAVAPISDIGVELLQLGSESIAMAIHSAEERVRIQELLEESRQRAEELHTQQEELQNANEELQEHTQALAASEEELKQQSDQLRVTNEELEEKAGSLQLQKSKLQVQALELEHAQQGLEIQTQQLELSNKYKSEFLSNMSHELRTPLNSLLILSRSLAKNREGNLTEKQVEAAGVIEGGGMDLLRLINEILDLSKVEAGKMEVNVENVELADLAAAIRQQFLPVAEDKGVEFAVTIGDGAPDAISSDSQRLVQILRNLLSNALKFTQEGSVILTIDAPTESALHGNLQGSRDDLIAFSVADSGSGVPEDKQAAIFEAFQQADGSTSRNYGGTGLGLTISRELAGLLGGQLHLEESSSQGSIFALYLPLSAPVPETPVATETSKPAETSTEESGDGTQPSEQGMTSTEPLFLPDDRETLTHHDRSLLIIEDDIHSAQILQELAMERGYKCLMTRLGKEALILAQQFSPSAVLLNRGLMNMEGTRVLEQLKSNPKTRRIPVHIISSQDPDAALLSEGAIGQRTTPVTADDLNDVFTDLEDQRETTIRSVLVVEDDAASEFAIRELVASESIEISSVSTGEAALEELASNPYDCVILDLGLPDISGFQVLERLSEMATAGTRQPPIIVYTGVELTSEEHLRLQQMAASIVMKGSESPARLIDDVSLFLHSLEQTLPRSQRETLQASHDSQQCFQGRTVLIVDDDTRNVFALSEVLAETGLVIESAVNGAEALEKLEANSEIAVVLMDVMMPVMDGLEATRKIRAQEKYASLPIIALTAKAMAQDREDCITAGADDYLSKPVDIDQLVGLLRLWLDQAT